MVAPALRVTQTARNSSDEADRCANISGSLTQDFFRSYPQSGLREFAQAFSCALGGDVALRSAKHFKADHEFPDCRRPQKRRIKVRVEMTFWMIDPRMIKAIRRRLMKAHRVREGNSEHAVVRGSHAMQNIAQQWDFVGRELIHASEVPATADQNFKRPNRPERHEREEIIVFINNSDTLPPSQRHVVAEKTAAV